MKKFLLIFLSLLILFIFFSLKSEFVLSQDPYPCPPGQDYCGDGCCDPDNGENSETCPDDCGEPSPCNNNGSCDGEEDCISCPLECGSCGYPCGCGDCETGQNAACDPDNPCITQLSCDQPDCHDTACWFSNCSGCGSGGPGCYCSTQSQCLACYTCICPIGDFDCTIRCNASNSTCYSECMDSSPGGSGGPGGSSVPSPSPSCPLTAPSLTCDCNANLNIVIDWDTIAGAEKYPLRIDDLDQTTWGACPIFEHPLGDYCYDDIYMTYFGGLGQAGHDYHIWLHAYNSSCPDPWVPTGSCNVTCPNPPSIIDYSISNPDCQADGSRIYELALAVEDLDGYDNLTRNWFAVTPSGCPDPGNCCWAPFEQNIANYIGLFRYRGNGSSAQVFQNAHGVTSCSDASCPAGCDDPYAACTIGSNCFNNGTHGAEVIELVSETYPDANTWRVVYKVKFDYGDWTDGSNYSLYTMANDSDSLTTCSTNHANYCWDLLMNFPFQQCNPSPPSTPTGLSQPSPCATQVDLQWNHDGDWGVGVGSTAYSFFVFVKKGSGSFVSLDGDPDCWNVVGLEAGGIYTCTVELQDYLSKGSGWADDYQWKVVASNNGSTGVVSGQCLVDQTCADASQTFTLTNTQPEAVSSGSMSPNGNIFGDNSISLQWPALADALAWGCNVGGNDNNYVVSFRADDSGFGPGDEQCTISGGGGVCSDGSLSCDSCYSTTVEWGRTYWWKVVTDNGALTNETIVSFIVYPGAWWQVVGGDIFAQTDITSNIPSTADNPFLMLTDADSLEDGIPICGNGSSCLSIGPELTFPDDVDQGSNDWRVQGSTYGGETYSYAWWVDHLKDEAKDPSPYAGGALPDPHATVIYETAGGTLNSVAGAISADSKVIILHDGDINISNDIDVSNSGGFLMVIASGTITFEFSLTGGDINDPDVEGIFIANDLVFQDNPFATGDYLWAAGSFIGWNSISLERDIGGLLSVNQPSMTFIFRPDFIINAPDEVKRIYFPTWQRIPG